MIRRWDRDRCQLRQQRRGHTRIEDVDGPSRRAARAVPEDIDTLAVWGQNVTEHRNATDLQLAEDREVRIAHVFTGERFGRVSIQASGRVVLECVRGVQRAGGGVVVRQRYVE